MTRPAGRASTRKPGARWPVSRRGRQVALFAHVAVSLGWMGAGSANVVLAFTAIGTSDVGLRHACYLLIERIDAFVVIPAAFAALVSGVLSGLVTPWGLLRYWWVLAKLVLTVGVVGFSTLGVGVWVELSIRATDAGEVSPYAVRLAGGAVANIVAFLIMTWLSVAKPWGTTPWVRRARVTRARPR